MKDAIDTKGRKIRPVTDLTIRKAPGKGRSKSPDIQGGDNIKNKESKRAKRNGRYPCGLA